MARTPLLNIRVDDETKQRWDAAARDAGYSLAEFVREAVDARIAADAPKPKAKKGNRQPGQIGLDPTLRAAGMGRTTICEHRIPPTAFCTRGCD